MFYEFLEQLKYKEKNNCNNFSTENCSGECVICPPCEECSSISCQTEKFCKNIGFGRDWYKNNVKNINK